MFDLLPFMSETVRLNQIIEEGAASKLTDREFIEREITNFKVSKRRHDMFDGEKYYAGRHDILSRERTVISADGELEPVKNLPNNRVVDNQYAKMVDQKKNYLLGQPLVLKSENDAYNAILKQVFNKRFQRLLKNIGEDALNEGLAWLFLYYNEQGELAFKRMKAYEITPLWHDAEHTVLDGAIRIYEVLSYEASEEKIIEKVEVYDTSGIYYFTLDGGTLIPDEIPFQYYFIIENKGQVQGWNWSKIPLVPFKYNGKEIPLIKKVKTLQDGLNMIISNFQNNMEEDTRNTILVLVNYDGENLGQFRKNLATYGAVKVRSIDGSEGDVKTLQVEVNSENYKAILEIFKKAIIENAMGYDAKDDRMAGNPNQMNIQSMYSDIDLDANDMETEFQASFEELLWFVNMYLYNAGSGDFEGIDVEVIFNRDILINETEAIDNCQKSVGLLSNETIVENHPWIDDPQKEMDRLDEQKKKETEEMYANAFASPTLSLNQATNNAKDGGLDGKE